MEVISKEEDRRTQTERQREEGKDKYKKETKNVLTDGFLVSLSVVCTLSCNFHWNIPIGFVYGFFSLNWLQFLKGA